MAAKAAQPAVPGFVLPRMAQRVMRRPTAANRTTAIHLPVSVQSLIHGRTASPAATPTSTGQNRTSGCKLFLLSVINDPHRCWTACLAVQAVVNTLAKRHASNARCQSEDTDQQERGTRNSPSKDEEWNQEERRQRQSSKSCWTGMEPLVKSV